MNWILMLMHAHWAMFAANLAPDHERGGAGNGDNPVEVNPNKTASEQNVATVPESGRSTEAVVATLASIPVDLARLIEGKSNGELTRPAQDGGWGLVEILPHFRDWEEIIGDRVSLILSEEAPTLEEYDDSLWAIEHGYRDQDPREAFSEFAERRNALIERLKQLEFDSWNRVGILPKRGRVSLHWFLDSVCDHDAKHVVQARDVLA